jgi:hypothetical protein
MKQIILALILTAVAIPAQAQFQSVTTTANGTLHSPSNFWAANSIALAAALADNPDVRVVRRVESGNVIDGGIVFYSGIDGEINLFSDDITGVIINAGPGNLYIADQLNNNLDTVWPGETVAYSWDGLDEIYTVISRWTPARLPISNGLIVRTSPSQTAARTITGTAGQITVTNGNGTSGNPTISLPSTITGNRTFADNLTVQGNTALGDAAGDTLTISGTITAANANGTAANSIANVGTLDNRLGVPNLGLGIVNNHQPPTSVAGTYDMTASGVTKTITSLTNSGTTATATSTAHGYSTGMTITISGATPAAYNGEFEITVVDANTFTYVMDSNPGGAATGSPVARNHWVRLFEGGTGSVTSGIMSVTVGAAGSNDSLLFGISLATVSSGGANIQTLSQTGWSWVRYARVSRTGSNARVEIYVWDPTRSYSISANYTPRAGAAPAAAFLGGSPGPYASGRHRTVADTGLIFPEFYTVDPPSIAAGAYGEIASSNDRTWRPVTTGGLKMQPVVSTNCLSTLPDGLVFVDVRAGSLGQIIWRFYNASGSAIDAGPLNFAVSVRYVCTNL